MTPKNYTLELSLFDLITVNPNFFYYKKSTCKSKQTKRSEKETKKKKEVKHFFF